MKLHIVMISKYIFEYRGEKIIPFLTFTQNLDFMQQDIENLVFEKLKIYRCAL